MYINIWILKHYKELERNACNGESKLVERSPKNSKFLQPVALVQIL